MPFPLPWIALFVALGVCGGGALVWWAMSRPPRRTPLPRTWAVAARPVFAVDERAVYRRLRDALPDHVLLAKLPLVRLCQPDDPRDAAYWYALLARVHVGFAVCSSSGRVLAAVDLVGTRPESVRRLQIKQAVLAACRVRYLRCTPEVLPSVAELQLLVPGFAAQARTTPTAAAAPQPRGAPTSWQDSGASVLEDSFFGSADDLRDSTGFGAFGAMRAGLTVRELSDPASFERGGGSRPDAPRLQTGS